MQWAKASGTFYTPLKVLNDDKGLYLGECLENSSVWYNMIRYSTAGENILRRENI